VLLHLQDRGTLIEQPGSEIGKSTVQFIINNHTASVCAELRDGKQAIKYYINDDFIYCICHATLLTTSVIMVQIIKYNAYYAEH